MIDARWFVPQSRPRLFLVGYHEELVGAAARSPRRATPTRSTIPGGARSSAPTDCGPRGCWRRWTRSSRRPVGRRSTAALRAQARYASRDFIDVDDDQPWWSDAEVARHSEMMFDRHRRQMESLARGVGGAGRCSPAFAASARASSGWRCDSTASPAACARRAAAAPSRSC